MKWKFQIPGQPKAESLRIRKKKWEKDNDWSNSRWWFQIFFIFTPTRGDDPIWRVYFSNGLKPPTRIEDETDVKEALLLECPHILFDSENSSCIGCWKSLYLIYFIEYPVWWYFQTCLFPRLFGEDETHFDKNFSKGFKPSTSPRLHRISHRYDQQIRNRSFGTDRRTFKKTSKKTCFLWSDWWFYGLLYTIPSYIT